MQKENQRSKRKLRKDDLVTVISGNNIGQKGRVLSISGQRVIVQGVNIRKKTMKPQGGRKGQIIEREAPIHISNLRVLVEENKPVKLRTRLDGEGIRELYYRDGDNEVLYRPVKKPKE